MGRHEIGVAVLAKTNGFCWYCGGRLTKDWERDHSTPRLKGGKYNVENLVPCCRGCNRSKGHRTSDEFKEFTKNKILRAIPTAEGIFQRYPTAFSDQDKLAIRVALSQLSRTMRAASVTWHGEEVEAAS